MLHGFGFANGLLTTGMPSSELPLALLWFNLGVEGGQLLFVFLTLGLGFPYTTDSLASLGFVAASLLNR